MTTYPSNEPDVDGEQLKQFIERVEKLEDEKSIVSGCIRDLYAEAKSVGFDPKIIRKIVAARAKAAAARAEEAALLKVYAQAIGQLDLF